MKNIKIYDIIYIENKEREKIYMSKISFINEIESILSENPDILTKESKDYFYNSIANTKEKDAKLSENAVAIIEIMKSEPNMAFNSKQLGEAIGKTSRSASGSMRKLVELGYVEKVGKDPVQYKITNAGMSI